MKASNVGPNQTVIYTPEATFFQSYDSIIIKIDFDDDGKRRITLDAEKYAYSKTTARHRNAYLGMTTKEIEAKIKNGEILLGRLN
jgi:hypothetical protein